MMSDQDMEDNGIHIDFDLTKVIVNSQGEEKEQIIGVAEKIIEEQLASSEGGIRNAFTNSRLPLASISSSVNEVSEISEQTILTRDADSPTVPPVGSLSDLLLISPQQEPARVFSELGPMLNSTMPTITAAASNSSLMMNEHSSAWSFEEIGAVTIVSVMVPFIIISNLFVIMSVVRFRRLHTPTNYFITSLAVVDIFVALATPFMVAIEVFHFGDAAGPEDVVLCLLPNRVLMMASGVSILTLATIAYDRHTALVSPLEYVNIMTSRKVAIMVSLTWIYSGIIVWLPVMAGWYHVPTDTAPCSANLIYGRAPVLFLSAIFVPSCIAILVCYFRIFLVARHHAKAIAAVEFAVHRRLQVKFMIKDTKYAKTLALVIGVFLILWLPYLLCVFIKVITSIKFDMWVQIYLILLAVFNSGINPWIYAFKNNELKAAFKRLFKEFCGDKFCIPGDRRSSLVSTISTTPRLSRTDSRMVSIVPDITVDTINEKLKRSLDSLDELDGEMDQGMTNYDLQERRQTIAEGASDPSSYYSQRNNLRQFASCSNLEAVTDSTLERTDSGKLSRSFSMDLVLPNENDAYDLNDSGIYHETSAYEEDLNSSAIVGHCNETVCDMSVSANPSTTVILPSSPPPYSPPFSPQFLSLPSSPVHIQPPPPSPKRTPHPQYIQAQIHAQYSAPDSIQLLTPATLHGITTSSSHQAHLHHTHSFCYVNEALQPDMSSTTSDHCFDSSAVFHPYFDSVPIENNSADHLDAVSTHTPHQHILSHTHSCPTFEAMSSFRPLLPNIWDGSVHNCSELGEPTTLTPLDGKMDEGFVNRVELGGDFSNSR